MLEAAAAKGSPVCVGLDPVAERLPAELRDGDEVEAIAAFCDAVLEAVAPHVPAVKLQAACFERYGSAGWAAMEAAAKRAHELGLIVILDAKRGDIGISAAHYAAALLERGVGRWSDAVTVHSYMGPDALEPFVEVAAGLGKGVFALVRTSNAGSDAVQGLALADGRTVAQAVATMVGDLGDSYAPGVSGYSHLGAVVGATKSGEAADLRSRLPRQLILVPGYGAQGGSAADVLPCFNADGRGAIVTASRSVIYAFASDAQQPWRCAIAEAARQFNIEIAAVLREARG